MPNVSNDLSQKLYATMEKHKEVSEVRDTYIMVAAVNETDNRRRHMTVANSTVDFKHPPPL